MLTDTTSAGFIFHARLAKGYINVWNRISSGKGRRGKSNIENYRWSKECGFQDRGKKSLNKTGPTVGETVVDPS